MHAVKYPTTPGRVLALAAALLVSGSAQMLTALAQKSNVAAPTRSGADPNQGPTRPRTVGEKRNGPRYDTGPIVRIELMREVNSIVLSSASGLQVRRSPSSAQPDLIAASQVRVESRRVTGAKSEHSSDSASGAHSRRAESVELSTVSTRSATAADRSGEARGALNPGARLVALDAERIVTSNAGLLIVAPADAEQMTTRDGKMSGDKARRTEENHSLESVPAVRLGNKTYRGEIHVLLNKHGTIDVINALPLEDYLRGVVPLELPPRSYPEIEALKAQAVAARSYALSHLGRFASEGFDLHDDTRSQIYGGLTAEQPLTNRAVEETRGLAAVRLDETGRHVPIEALYTADCGGRTEDNESIFLTNPLPYLRSVECADDNGDLQRHEIRGERPTSAESRPLARDLALLDVLGFKMPRRVDAQFLQSAVSQDEAWRWLDRLRQLAKRTEPSAPRGDVTQLPGFASHLAESIFGRGLARLVMTRAEIAYILAGLGLEDLPQDARCDVAMLLRDGLLSIPEGRVGKSTPLTRGYVLQTIARVLFIKTQVSSLISRVAGPAENGWLMITPSSGNSRVEAQTKLSTGARMKAEAKPAIATTTLGQTAALPVLEMDKSAKLFRRVAGESYPIDRIALVGGEMLTYHVNSSGRVDFLEAGFSPGGGSVEGVAGHALWREKLSAEELKGRLARSRVSVGELDSLTPAAYGDSGRVLELEIKGTRGRSVLRGYQIRSALGLKDNLFAVEMERDERGRVTGFAFIGRGWGHGVGMCQLGAYNLARKGRSFADILKKYYRGVQVIGVY